jgi:hypothetical protein
MPSLRTVWKRTCPESAMPDPDKNILPHSQPPGRKPLPGESDGDDDATYDADEWEDLEDDRDPHAEDRKFDYLASLERRGYFT